MADPISITGLVLQIGVVLKQLHDYGKEVKGARKDIAALSSELYALKGVLEDCKAQSSTPRDLGDVLQTAQEALDALLQSLATPQSKARRVQQSLTWPLKDDDVGKILSKLERVKSLLLLDLMGDVHGALQDFDDMKRDVKTIAETVKEESKIRAEQKTSDAQRKLLEHISPVSSGLTHRQICSVPKDPSSGSWFLDGPLKTWLVDSPFQTQILSLVGMSGAGKTTLVASTIERLKQTNFSHPPTAYMYCTYNDSATRETRNIFGAWLAQLWHLKPAVLEPLATRFGKHQQIQVSHLIDALVDLATSVGSIVLILDALNESKDPSGLCAEILELTKRTKSIRVLVSSTTDLGLLATDCRMINITSSAILVDVKTYIKHKRLRNAVLSRVPEEAFLEAILPRTNGMFRWASCQMDIVSQYSTPKKVKEALRHLPGSLDDTYVALFQRVPAVSRDLVREALLWLSYSRRPLRLNELLDAVVLEEDDTDIDDDCRIFPPSRLVEMCEGLVTWNAATNIVALAHSSVRTFLGSDFISSSPVAFFKIDFQAANLSIIRKCLTYLLMTPFAIGYCTKAKLYSLHEEYPLLEYAATMWAVHVHPYMISDEAHRILKHATATKLSRMFPRFQPYRLSSAEVALVDKLLASHSPEDRKTNFKFWVYCLIPESSYFIIRQAHPLYYAASFGLTQVVESLLTKTTTTDRQSPWYIDRKAGRAYSTALQVACWRGHLDVVEVLLKAGADPSSTDASGLTCWGCAEGKGHKSISDMLVEAGALSGTYYQVSGRARMATRPVMSLAGTTYKGRANLYAGDESEEEEQEGWAIHREFGTVPARG